MKTFDKIGSWLFNITDRYFQGEHSAVSNKTSKFSGQISGSKTVCWELNQGVADIIVKDLIVSVKCIIPSIIIKKIQSVINRVHFYFLVDAVIEEETLDPELVKTNNTKVSETNTGKNITWSNEVQKALKKPIISLSEWVKIKLPDIGWVLGRYKRVKPFYLLGDFSPVNYTISSNKSKFLDTYVYNLRN